MFWFARIFLDRVSCEFDSAIYWEHDWVPTHSDFHRERTSTTTLKMTREYTLDAGRSLVIKKKSKVYSIIIFEMGSDNRRQEFPLVRWSSFTRAIYEIDNTVNDFKTNHQLKYSYHIGGGHLRPHNSGRVVRRHHIKKLFKFYFKFISVSCKYA